MSVDLLTNAVESIRAGVEDYEVGTHGRLLSAVRGIHAGILLLYKELLRRRSPPGSSEVLLKERIVPRTSASGDLIFVGTGKRTVGAEGIRERFDGLGVSTDWNRLGAIAKVRNEIEHYCTNVKKKAIEGLISDAFLIIRNFVAIELMEDPVELFGDECWSAMLNISAVYEAERADCEKAMAAVQWGSDALAEGVLDLSCPSCSGSLLMPSQAAYDDQMTLHCRSCGDDYASENFVAEAIEFALRTAEYESIKDGGDELYATCPTCSNKTYVIDEGRCAWCGESVDDRCALCRNKILPSELICAPYCSYCEHLTSKDD